MPSDDRVTFEVRVVPGAAHDVVGGTRGGALLVRVSARAVEGAANEALLRSLSRALRVARTELRIERGVRGRLKAVSAPARAAERLHELMK